MPLNTPKLISDIQNALAAQGMPADAEANASIKAAQLKLATNLAMAIQNFILSANPIPVATSGGAGSAIIS